MKSRVQIYGLRAKGSDVIMYAGKCEFGLTVRLKQHFATAERIAETNVQRWIRAKNYQIEIDEIALVTGDIHWPAFERAAIVAAANRALFNGYVITNQQLNPFRYKTGEMNEDAIAAYLDKQNYGMKNSARLIEKLKANELPDYPKHFQPTGGAK